MPAERRSAQVLSIAIAARCGNREDALINCSARRIETLRCGPSNWAWASSKDGVIYLDLADAEVRVVEPIA
jgi:hypothetical protein